MMDKKIKRFVKKNLKEDSHKKYNNDESVPYYNSVTWQISPKNSRKLMEDKANESSSTITQSNTSNIDVTHAYLPLRDVPIHDLVKKLRREFELEGDMTCLPSQLNDLWSK